MVRRDPAALAAAGVVIGVGAVLAGSLIAGFRGGVGFAGGVDPSVVAGFRLRLLAVFSAARLDVAVAGMVAAALVGLSRPSRPVLARRPVLVTVGALSAYIGFAALVRGLVFASLLGQSQSVFLGATLEALGPVPVAAVATVWAAAMLGRASSDLPASAESAE
jgi:hypothetical protein